HDPFVGDLTELNGAQRVPLEAEVVHAADCVIIATDHSTIDYDWVVTHAQLVVDTRNITKPITVGREKIITL
ncbi:MAG: UDP binding domain-containing protein, partial [Candidatus Entotheonellia bacterium]